MMPDPQPDSPTLQPERVLSREDTRDLPLYPAELHAALDRLAAEHVRPIALALVPLYLLYAVAHMLTLSRALARPMTVLAVATALVLLGIASMWGRGLFAMPDAHPVAALILSLVLANSFAHLALTAEPRQSTNMMLLVVGAGMLLLRRRWFILMAGLTWLCWVVVVLVHSDEAWGHYLFGMLAATLLAAIVRHMNVRTIVHMERLRLADARHTHMLESTARAAQHSEERFRKLSHAAFEGLVFHDDGVIVDMNQTALNMLGCKLDEVKGRHIWDFVTAESREAILAHANQFDGQPYEVTGVRKDGTTFPAEIRVRVIPSDDRLLRVVAVQDITARKQIEAEREQLIEELDSFAHTVAHDLKGPLGQMMSYAHMLTDLEDVISEADRKHYIHEIAQGGARLTNIIDELLLLAQVRHGDVPYVALEMESIVLDACQRVIPLQQEYDAEIVLPESWPVAAGHGPWVQEVWYNYVCNAIKYGGEPPRVELGADEQPDGMVRFWVRDNGAGLAPEARAQLFRPFNRLDRVDTKGYGLGLSIVQRIATRLGGTVGVESEVGAGSEFYFTLPTRIDRSPALETTRPESTQEKHHASFNDFDRHDRDNVLGGPGQRTS